MQLFNDARVVSAALLDAVATGQAADSPPRCQQNVIA